MKVSIVIPVYNEEKVIGSCLASLAKQDYKDLEVIVVDDGSTDNMVSEIRSAKAAGKIRNLFLLQQKHQGPGAARNLGASKATGEILVFVDADMEFDQDFVTKLTMPIVVGKTIGTFSQEEFLFNKDNAWARLWNLNLGRGAERMIGEGEYPEGSPVFRAILRSKFVEAGGFDTAVGYTDDWSVSRKLGILATIAPGARFYHRNPASLSEIWAQARWFGKNEFLTKNLMRKLYNLFRYCPLWAILVLLDLKRFIFKFVYNTAVFTSVLFSFFGEEKYK